MGRYTKLNSNYLMKSRHQGTDVGSIMERDWVTTNGLNVLRFGPGRRTVYNSGNFVFTTSNVPSYQKKYKLSTETKEWKWADVETADGTVNDIKPNFYTNDLRNYAYYGSMVELIRTTVEEIVTDFPGRLVSTTQRSTEYGGRYVEEMNKYPLVIPKIDDVSYEEEIDGNRVSKTVCWHYGHYGTKDQWVKLNEYQNETLAEKIINVGELYFDINDNVAKKCFSTESGVKYFEQYGNVRSEFNKIYYTTLDKQPDYWIYDYSNSNFRILKNDEIAAYNIIDGYTIKNQFNIDLHHDQVILDKYDNPMRYMSKSWDKYCVIFNNDEYEIKTYTINNIPNTKECILQTDAIKIKEVNIEGVCNGKEEKIFVINVYSIGNNIVYTYTPTNGEKISIQPLKKYIDGYFNSLHGFKSQLLRRDTNPYFSNNFITPIEHNFTWYYVERKYTWPSNGYCIDISSMLFSSFIDKLLDMAQKMDELWADNICRSMTHEAIKNFDWTYSREYYEDDAQDNIDGGERMQKILHIIGRCFDDVKTYIDNIKQTNKVSYNRYNNGSEALLSDRNELGGVDVVSTIGSDYVTDATIKVNDDTKKGYAWLSHPTSKDDFDNEKKYILSKLKTWYPTLNSDAVYADMCDNEFNRRLALSRKRIMQTKGTQQSIEMMFALFGLGKGIDYEIKEEAYWTEKMIPFKECINGDGDNDKDWTKIVDNFDGVESTTKGYLATEINAKKQLDHLYYEDVFSGVPLRTVYLGREQTPYIVPYYDQSQMYDNDLYYQGKGGWGKTIYSDGETKNGISEYKETLSYLHVVGTMGELLSLNSMLLDENDIYYVANLNDYISYDENPPIFKPTEDDKEYGDVTMSHFFTLQNEVSPNKLYSWKNIVVQGELNDDNTYKEVTEEAFEKVFDEIDWTYNEYKTAFAKMTYLDSIIPSNVANNPHVGYGKYDDGKMFIEYMKLPFKYSIDKMLIDSDNLRELAKLYDFSDIDEHVTNDKIQILNTRQTDKEHSMTDFVKYTVNGDALNTEYVKGEDKYNNEKRWYINSKVLTITNNVTDSTNGYFERYFKNVILPYVMQVIPSTTILKLKGFEK